MNQYQYQLFIGGYSSTTVVRIPVSSTGAEVADGNSVAGYKYKITFNTL